MTNSCPIDLRERIVAHVWDGHTCHAAARVFDASAGLAIKLISRWRAVGSSARRGKPALGKLGINEI